MSSLTRFAGPAGLTCATSAALSAVMGLLASVPYTLLWESGFGYDPTPAWRAFQAIGAGTGAMLGLLAGLVWCERALRRVAAGKGVSLIEGGSWGLTLGFAVAFAMHLALACALFNRDSVLVVVIACGFWATLFGAPSGAFLGALCGVLWSGSPSELGCAPPATQDALGR